MDAKTIEILFQLKMIFVYFFLFFFFFNFKVFEIILFY